jgi:hypothetical protein
MTFKEFLELEASINQGPLQLIKTQIKLCQPVKDKGSSISRMAKAGGGVLPARPAKIASLKGPLTSPTLLK